MSIAGWLPEEWLKTIALIIARKPDGEQSIGTCFLVGHKNSFCLVTAKHVIRDLDTDEQYTNEKVFFNSASGGIVAKDLDLIRSITPVQWHYHSNSRIDLAVTHFPLDATMDDVKVFPENMFAQLNSLSEGDDVFFLGFPLGKGAIEIDDQGRLQVRRRIKPILRGGMIASREDDGTLLIEANVYPGSSGSPVFLKPSPITLSPQGIGLGGGRGAVFVGIATGYVPYKGENTNLARVYSADQLTAILASAEFESELPRAPEESG